MNCRQNCLATWTPEQVQEFLDEWNDDEPLQQLILDEAPTRQYGRGEKRTIDELDDNNNNDNNDDVVNDGASTSKQGDDDERYFSVIDKISEVKIKKFKTTALKYVVKLTNTLASVDIPQAYEHVYNMIESLLNTVFSGVAQRDQVRLVIKSPHLKNPISLPFMERSRLTPERVLTEVEKVIQSNEDFRLDESVEIDFLHVNMPHGGVGTKRAIINLEKHLDKKRCIVRIQNSDEICLARALVVAIAKIENDRQYKVIANSRKVMQQHRAHALHEKAGVAIGPCGLDEVKQFQAYLTDYQINIVSSDHQDSIIYSGPDKEKRIYLLLHDNHYEVITSMPAFFARKKYCHTCKKGYDHSINHLCPEACKCCRFPNCPNVQTTFCTDCNRTFKSQACYDRHKQSIDNEKSVCDSLASCKLCSRTVKRSQLQPNKHQCGKTKCPICGRWVNIKDHKCYMQPETKKKKRKTRRRRRSSENDVPEGRVDARWFLDTECEQGEGESTDEEEEEQRTSTYGQILFFDFECRQENGNHEPNLCVVHNEVGDEWVFRGDDTRNEFCEWLFRENSSCLVVAHNFQGYDGYFIQQYLYANSIIPEVRMRGAKILSLEVSERNIKFIDSLNFIPMPLAKFPKTFGMDELAKGYFPHLFNKKENENYVGPIPPAPYYNPNGMKPDEREKFLQWHKNLKESDYVFDFQQEILAYCRSDVDILRRCCLEFRELFRAITDIDPFERSITIASACNLVYCTNFLKEETIAIIPPHGYHPKTKQSNIALRWLSYTAEKNEICIEHKRNGGERRVGDYSLDGYHEETNTAYEFHGCFWHGEYCVVMLLFAKRALTYAFFSVQDVRDATRETREMR